MLTKYPDDASTGKRERYNAAYIVCAYSMYIYVLKANTVPEPSVFTCSPIKTESL